MDDAKHHMIKFVSRYLLTIMDMKDVIKRLITRRSPTYEGYMKELKQYMIGGSNALQYCLKGVLLKF